MMRLTGRGAWIAPLAGLLLLTAAGASAAASSSNSLATAFRLPSPSSKVDALVGAPEGGAWFTAANGIPGQPNRYLLSIERISPEGSVSRLVERKGAGDFARAPDGSVWFTGFRCICRLRPDGEITQFPLPEWDYGEERMIAQDAIVAGGDGSFWFSSTRSRADRVGPDPAAISHISADGQIVEFPLREPAVAGGWASSLTVGPEGAIWFTEQALDVVGSMTANGQVTRFQLPQYAHPDDIATGSDGNLWFTQQGADAASIGRITPAGELRDIPLPGEAPYADRTTAGPDGRVWFANGPGMIGRIAPNGGLSSIPLLDQATVTDLAVGVEGDVWYTADPVNPSEAGIVGRVDPAPLAVRLSTAKPAHRARAVRVLVDCLDGVAYAACSGRLTLRSGKRIVAGRPFQLQTDRSRAFGLRLGRSASARLRRHGRLRLTGIATIDGSRVKQGLLLKLPKRGARKRARQDSNLWPPPPEGGALSS
jgi:streptogramin lyase